MTAKFHIDDTVYIKSLDTISRVSGLVTSVTLGGKMSVIGYEVVGVSAYVAENELELVEASPVRYALITQRWKTTQQPRHPA